MNSNSRYKLDSDNQALSVDINGMQATIPPKQPTGDSSNEIDPEKQHSPEDFHNVPKEEQKTLSIHKESHSAPSNNKHKFSLSKTIGKTNLGSSIKKKLLNPQSFYFNDQLDQPKELPLQQQIKNQYIREVVVGGLHTHLPGVFHDISPYDQDMVQKRNKIVDIICTLNQD